MSPEGRWPLGQWILCEPVVTVTRTLRLPARVPVKKQQHTHTLKINDDDGIQGDLTSIWAQRRQ